MATMTLTKKELPELEFPLDYPACLDRIVTAAEYRADYEINVSYLKRLFVESLEDEMNAISEDLWSYSIAKFFTLNSATAAQARSFLLSRKDAFRPLICFKTQSECDDFSKNHILPKL